MFTYDAYQFWNLRPGNIKPELVRPGLQVESRLQQIVLYMPTLVKANASHVQKAIVYAFVCGTGTKHAVVVQSTRVMQSLTRRKGLRFGCTVSIAQAPATPIFVGWSHVGDVAHLYWIGLSRTKGSGLAPTCIHTSRPGDPRIIDVLVVLITLVQLPVY